MFQEMNSPIKDENGAVLADAKQRVGALERQLLDAYEVAAMLFERSLALGEQNLALREQNLNVMMAVTELYEMVLGA